MTVTIENETGSEFDFPYEDVIRLVAEKVLETEQCPYEAEVEVLITDDPAIQKINRETRAIDRPTDVLSFPMIGFEAPASYEKLEEDADAFDPETGALLLGDIVISADRVREQAKLYGHSEKRELAFLVAHSMLHLLGYDHPAADAVNDQNGPTEMEEKQEAVLQSLGITRD